MSCAGSITQHLEMMLNKKNRCEDWVASVASQKESVQLGDDNPEENELDCTEGELSELCDSTESSKRNLRKKVTNKRLLLNLGCEWKGCQFFCRNSKEIYVEHVSNHLPNLLIMSKANGDLCYQCLWQSCGFQSADSSEITRHVNFHSYHSILKSIASELHKTWNIPECSLSNENRNWVPDLFSPFMCGVVNCDFTVDNFYHFINHVDTHLDNFNFEHSEKVHCIWKGCKTFICTRKSVMKTHIKSHTKEKTLACPTCGAMFCTNTKYMDHCNRRLSIRNECNQCQYCLKYYANERLLRDHMRYHINSQKCSFCEMTFSTPGVLANHIRFKHLDSRPFHCNLCSFSTPRADDYNVHLMVHENEPRYQCQVDECKYSCRSVGAFKKHFNSTHLKEQNPIYKCHLCDKEYQRGHSLGKHLRTMHKLERLPGHSKFRYMKNKDGYFRLQVERYESLELDDIKTPVTSIEEQHHEVIVTQHQINEFSVSFHKEKARGVLLSGTGVFISIDEMDGDGNVIRTSTVQEELLHSLPDDATIIVANKDPLVGKESSEMRMELEENNNRSDPSSISNNFTLIECSKTDICERKKPILKIENDVIFVKRRKKKTYQLSDAECNESVVIITE